MLQGNLKQLNMKQPSDLINDEIRDLQGSKTKLRLVLWELMKQAKMLEIKRALKK